MKPPGMSEGLGPHAWLGQTPLSPLSLALRGSWSGAGGGQRLEKSD